MDSELTSEASVKALDQGVATTDSPEFAGLSVDTDTLFVDASTNRVGIGTSSPREILELSNTSGSPSIRVNTANGTGNSFSIRHFDNENSEHSRIEQLISNGTGERGDILFYTASTGGILSERLRINAFGNVGIGTNSPDEILHTTGYIKSDDGFYAGQSKSLSSNNTTTRFVVANADSNARLWLQSDEFQPLFLINRTSTTGQVLRFGQGGSQVGSIAVTATSTSYNTSSDYRLKEDIKPVLNPSDRVLALNPVNFAWKTDGTRVDGFLAHEAQEVVPEAVTGEKDALDSEGNPEYQGIDQGKLVPLLTAALQDALQKIEALETRVTELEQGQ